MDDHVPEVLRVVGLVALGDEFDGIIVLIPFLSVHSHYQGN